ncbi:hypothetical protein [Spirilliplanes yamanashiensis]|nr:hypothetical protein [Spirilliplanes yamanashiensis]MDP9820159.1 hypothetical protein [Spirilliplanes yamanashiensis]
MWSYLVYALALGALAAGLRALGTRVRRRGIGGTLMNPVDEIWRPTAHHFRAETAVHDQRLAPRAGADDKP